MRIVRLNGVTNFLKVEPQSFDDLYLLAIVISPGDKVEAHSYRRFKANERDTGEQKEVFIQLLIEKVEIDKGAGRLRLMGEIKGGHPQEFISMGSHHTINVAPGDIIDIQKEEWKSYIIRRLKQAVADSRKPRLGIVILDDEKALFAYVRGYGIDLANELYSHLSKRMKEKDFAKQRNEYFNEIISSINNMSVDLVIVAGPGFTKDDIKRYMADNHIEVKKRLSYMPASDAERSGIREVMRSNAVAELLESEHVKKEFEYLNTFLQELRLGKAHYGPDNVAKAFQEDRPERVLVNDSAINSESIKKVLDLADKKGVKIEIFNSEDDAGIQLKNFKDIACI